MSGRSYDLFTLVTRSERRKDVLEALKEGGRTLSEINDELGTVSSGILPEIRNLERNDLVKQKGKYYELTNYGTIVKSTLDCFENGLKTAEDKKNFLNQHEIDDIPRQFLKRFNMLRDSEVIESTTNDILKPHNQFINRLMESRWIKGIVPIYHPDYGDLFSDLVKKTDKIDLILNDDVYSKARNEIEGFEQAIQRKNIQITRTQKDLKLGFTVTDHFISIGFFKNDGTYDINQDLMSQEEDAIEWGEELFNYIKKELE